MADSCRERVGGCCGCVTISFAISAGIYSYQHPDWQTIAIVTLASIAGFIVCGWIVGTKPRLAGSAAWRTLRGTDFEHFLIDAFRHLAYEVHHVGQTGDQGVDLILTMGSDRIAVQAKGYEGSVGNAAVQQAFTGMHYHRCQRCAVVTNSTFTSSALALAATLPGCTLVAGNQIDDLISGRLRI